MNNHSWQLINKNLISITKYERNWICTDMKYLLKGPKNITFYTRLLSQCRWSFCTLYWNIQSSFLSSICYFFPSLHSRAPWHFENRFELCCRIFYSKVTKKRILKCFTFSANCNERLITFIFKWGHSILKWLQTN